MKKLLGIVVLGLLLSGNVYAENTLRDLEKCINSKSKLLDAENIKNTCIFKLQKKLPANLAKLKDITATGREYLIVEAKLTNISTDHLITEVLLQFHHDVQYDKEKGLLILEEDKTEIDQFSYYWIEPGNSDRAVLSLSWDGELGFTYSNKSKISKDFKLTIDNLKIYKNWDLKIKEIYGFEIN